MEADPRSQHGRPFQRLYGSMETNPLSSWALAWNKVQKIKGVPTPPGPDHMPTRVPADKFSYVTMHNRITVLFCARDQRIKNTSLDSTEAS